MRRRSLGDNRRGEDEDDEDEENVEPAEVLIGRHICLAQGTRLRIRKLMFGAKQRQRRKDIEAVVGNHHVIVVRSGS